MKKTAAKSRDPYSAVWVSHSSMGDFIKCPRCYYLHNVYKDPKTRRKINVTTPALALGVAVHEVVEGLARFPADKRFHHSDDLGQSHRSPLEELKEVWKKVAGKKGGFKSLDEETATFARAEAMIRRVVENPSPLMKKTVKLKEGENGLPPNFLLSEEENIILCGKIDWLIWEPMDDSLHVLDFKTGKNEESDGSLQLPIYQLLLNKLQKRKITGASYWYLDRDNAPVAVDLPDHKESYEKVIKVAREVAAARAQALIEGPDKVFVCPRAASGGCFACRPFEKILRGEAEYIGVGEYNQDLFIIPQV